VAVVVLVGWAGRTAGAGAGVAQPPAAHGCGHRSKVGGRGPGRRRFEGRCSEAAVVSSLVEARHKADQQWMQALTVQLTGPVGQEVEGAGRSAVTVALYSHCTARRRPLRSSFSRL
jgi:hypothetical protein